MCVFRVAYSLLAEVSHDEIKCEKIICCGELGTTPSKKAGEFRVETLIQIICDFSLYCECPKSNKNIAVSIVIQDLNIGGSRRSI